MAGRIRAHDWASTPLGPIENWPPSLKAVVDLMLCGRQPAYIAFGPELTSLYNDGYIPILGRKHPDSLGQPYSEVWPEIWARALPLIEATIAGAAQHFVDHPIALAGRADCPTNWFTFSWTPLRDEAGTVKGFYCSANETTAQVLAQAALRESEERLRFSLKGARAAAWQWDFRTQEQVWSPESYELHGRDPRLGKPSYDDWLHCLHPDDRAKIGRIFQKAVAKKLPDYRTEYRVILPSGEVRWLNSLAKIDYAEDGGPLRMSGINLDVTERKRAEVALRKAEEYQRQKREELETILAAIPAAVLIARDAGCSDIIGNPAAHRLRRVQPQMSLSKSAAHGKAPKSYEVFSNGRRLSPCELPMQRAASTKNAVVAEELELRFTEGDIRFELANALPLFNNAGEVCGAVGVFTDITELKRTEAALRESEERLRLALDASGAGTWEMDLETGRAVTSDRARALKGLPPGTTVTKENMFGAAHPEDLPRLRQGCSGNSGDG